MAKPIRESGGFCEVRGARVTRCAGADLIEAGLNEGAVRTEAAALWALFSPGARRWNVARGMREERSCGTARD
jgi:hypothetical protein